MEFGIQIINLPTVYTHLTEMAYKHPYLHARIESVGPKNGQRRVVLNTDGTTFGTFDAHEMSQQGVLQIATSDWAENRHVHVVLMATMTVDVTSATSRSDQIKHSADNPDGWEDHSFCGTIEAISEDTASLLGTVFLFDGLDSDDAGVRLHGDA